MKTCFLFLAAWGLSLCAATAQDPAGKDDIVVFQRNAGPSPGPEYKKLAENLRLGSKVYSLPPDAAWLALRGRIVAEEKSSDLPLVFSGELKFPDGEHHWVTVQLELRLSGDGAVDRGPVIYCDMFVVDQSDEAKPKLLWRGSQFLGTLQNSKLHRGLPVAGKDDSFSLKIEDDGSATAMRTLAFQTAGCSQLKVVEEKK